MYWGVGPPKTGAGLGGGLLTLDSLVHLPSGREDWGSGTGLRVGGGIQARTRLRGARTEPAKNGAATGPQGVAPAHIHVHTHTHRSSQGYHAHTKMRTHAHAHFSPDPPRMGGSVPSSANMLLASSLSPGSPPFTVKSAGEAASSLLFCE